MPKIDRTYSTPGNLFEQKLELIYYLGKTKGEIGKGFAYLNRVAYNHLLGCPPSTDKTVFSMQKN